MGGSIRKSLIKVESIFPRSLCCYLFDRPFSTNSLQMFLLAVSVQQLSLHQECEGLLWVKKFITGSRQYSVLSLTLPAGPADRFLQMCFALIGCLNCFLTGLSHHVSYFSLMMLNKAYMYLYIRCVHLSASWQGGKHPNSEIYMYQKVSISCWMYCWTELYHWCSLDGEDEMASLRCLTKRQGRKTFISISEHSPVQHIHLSWHISAGHKTSHSIIC